MINPFELQPKDIISQVGKSADYWTLSNLPLIQQVLQDELRETLDLDSCGHTLSELPLCSMWHHIDCPDGFKLIPHGDVRILDDQRIKVVSRRMEHVFALNDTTQHPLVLCFTFAQFYDAQFPHERCNFQLGQRVEYYRSMAPDLVTIYPGFPVARLLGTVSDI